MQKQSGGSEENLVVTCHQHGERENWAILCLHIFEGVGQGVFFADPDQPLSDAWCKRCESLLAKEGSWTPKMVEAAHLKTICDLCYPKAISRNQLHLV